ncbi:uncharacterized protein DUF3881 [Lachnotalea glycerini]|uniref:DUF3881 family protein n=1 Tax=Lachnotalea glycerini TaxID=1763509 RepID=A0A255I325_9FIRM|nr:DUF3881 family protein [Lachnotalea glycerini]PXV85324.1 uncharacterized protein DUF3881 [Lachnotalea glycerini]RDY30211.1 DUF3881 family protein [Lachnotalea glycerini]
MHSYLRAIGFSNIKKKKDLDSLIKYVIHNSDKKDMAEIEEESLFTEIYKEFSKSVGINIRGEYNEENEFSINYYYPYLKGKGITSNEDVSVEKHAEKESYAGIVDDVKVGVSLIFYLQNITDYMNEKRIGALSKQNISITLSALSTNGNIILPIGKNEKQIKNTKEASMNRNILIAAARNGDEDAIESLTLEDIDTYTMISKRILNEDVFTIVDSYFMPYGIECDQYSILGEIIDFESEINSYTKEELYIMTINTNSLTFDVCINKKDLIGEPSVGRRFKGIIWMQGKINFPQ